MGDVLRVLRDSGTAIAASPVSPAMLAGMLKRIDDNTISGKIAKTVFEEMWQSGRDADTIIEEKGLRQVTDTGAIEAAIDAVIAANMGQVEEYRAGKEKVFGFFVGQVMKATKGKGNPAAVNELLKRKLAK
jgi:aspartyl-tRNA(Asn)/glutamyl-tRNA(Gln) amidotransferase subunit B